MNSIEVSEINIKIGEKKILLTLDEIKELQTLLNTTFGQTVYPYSYPYTQPCLVTPPFYDTGTPLWTVPFTTADKQILETY